MQIVSGIEKPENAAIAGITPTKVRRIRMTKEIAEAFRTLNTEGWIHVMTYHGKWKVRKHGAGRASGIYADKATAIAASKELLKSSKGTHIFIHDASGNVEQTIIR